MPASEAAATGLAATASGGARDTSSLAGVAAQTSATRPAMFADELDDRQRAAYQLDIQTFKLRQQHAEKAASGIRVVDNAIKSSARMYIPDDKMTATVRETIQALAGKYKRTKNQIIEQFHIQFQSLKNAPAKDKIEQWVADWENMRSLIINNESTGLFGSETIFIDEFLRAGRKWAPNFCDSWVQQKDAANLIPEFFDTARHYRMAVEKTLNQDRLSSRSSANAATLQGHSQPGQKSEGGDNSDGKKRNRWEQELLKRTKCVCKEKHLFRECPYIMISARPSGWKESKQLRNEIRGKIHKNLNYFTNIKKITDTNILDGLIEDDVKKGDRRREKEKDNEKEDEEEPVNEDKPVLFANMANSGRYVVNPLRDSILYDSGCNDPLTWDRSRFVGEITPVDDDLWVDTPDGDLQVVGKGTMLVKGTRYGKPRDLLFENVAYVPNSKVSMISVNKLKKKKTWEIVDKAPNQHAIPLKWVFTYKCDADGYLIKHKARLVVRGDLQKLNDQDVYPATLAFKVFRTLVALIAAFKLETRQLDAVNAFLNAHNDEAVYCYLPDGYKQPKKVMKVLKALYGQRKSPLLWLRTLCMKCMELGLYQIPGESCLFINRDGIYLFFYVDDIVFAYRLDKLEEVEEYISQFKKWFEIRDMGQLTYFLGVRVIRNVDAGIISLVQDAYMDKLTKEYGIISDRRMTTPLPIDQEMTLYEGEINAGLMNLYRKKVGSICYSAIMTRPDIAKAASKLAEHLKSPGPEHMKAVDHCLKYLNATKYLGIGYSAAGKSNLTVRSSEKEEVLKATADASYATGSDRRSGEGYTFKLFGGLIDWAARKQLTVTTSTTEAELLAMLHAGKEVI